MLNKKGSIMAITMIILVVFMLMGTFTVDFVVNETAQVSRLKHKAQAKYVARTGVLVAEAAIEDMANHKTEINKLNEELAKGDILSLGNPTGEHTYDILLKLEEDGGLLIRSSATVKGQTEFVEKVMATGDPVAGESTSVNFTHAVFTEGKLRMTITPHMNLIGKIGTNSQKTGDIQVESGYNMNVITSLTPGADPKKIINKPSWVTGNPKYEFIPPIAMDTPIFPEFPVFAKKPDINSNWENTLTNKPFVINTDSYYKKINLNGWGHALVVDTTAGDISLVVDEFINNGGLIHIKGDNKLKIYAAKMNIGNCQGFNLGGNRRKLEIYYGGTPDLTLSGSTEVNGSLYANTANINLTAGAGIRGNIVTGGPKITVNGGTIQQDGVIYGPNAHIAIVAGGKIRGAVIGKTAEVTGGVSIEYVAENTEYMPIPIDKPLDFINGKVFKPGYFK